MDESQNPTPPKVEGGEIADYYEGVKELEIQGHETGIRKARNALFVTAGLMLVGELIAAAGSGMEWTPLAIAIIAFEVGVFIALAFWTKSKPFSAIIVGIVFFLALWVLAIVTVGTQAIYSGIIVRIVILGVLISALKSAKAWESLKKNRS